ncbi:MAG TPA: pyridoxal-phosphate dependent enzyme, partial [Saprospiraceae bacterium]|nr:pyridoxal-phosphate dependent enzyme [Saprospiraceae bacterium]
KVVLCPSNVDAMHPESYYSKAQSITAAIEGGFYLNQNFNEINYLTHYKSTAPEIWAQTNGHLTHVIAAASTGGTISGLGKFFKEQNESIKILGVDCAGSSLSQYFYEGTFDSKIKRSTCIEGLGKDIIPGNFKSQYIDEIITIEDRSAIKMMLDLSQLEGIMTGGTSGATMAALAQIAGSLRPTDNVVLIFPDHGSKYLSKYYSAEWREKMGFGRLKEDAA